MGFKNRNHKTDKTESKDQTNVSVPAENAKKIVVPACIALLRTLAIDAAKLPEIPESMLKQRSKIVDSLNKLADRIHNGLGAAVKKAEREAAKAKRADAKTKRDAVKKTKKLDAIKILREKLAKMEAEVAPADEKK